MKKISTIDAAPVLLEAGIPLLQFRHKGQFTREHFQTLRVLAGMCESAGATLVVNDRADIAMLLGCALHVGQDDLAPADARRLLGERAMIGYSTHNAQQLEVGAGEPVDYLAAGPVFATPSKDNPDPVVGIEALASLRKLTRKPLVAIGGITLENAGEVYAAGVDSVALISALIPADGDLKTMRGLAEDWLALGRSRRVRRDSARDMV